MKDIARVTIIRQSSSQFFEGVNTSQTLRTNNTLFNRLHVTSLKTEKKVQRL